MLRLLEIFLLKNTDTLSFQEIIEGWDRTTYTEKQNRGWLSAKLFRLKKYKFIKPLYMPTGGRPALEKLQLTEEGKKELAKLRENRRMATEVLPVYEPQIEIKTGNDLSSFEKILNTVTRLSMKYPAVKYGVKYKEISVLIHHL